MADGKIYITISDTRGGSGAGVSNDADKGSGSENKENAALKYARHRFFNFVEGQTKQFVNYSVGNIGNFTGNYQSQRDVETALRGINFGINLATAIAAGAKMGGGWGALIAGTIAIGSEAINFGYREKTEQFENKKTNRNISLMRERLGLEGLTNGGRTGNQ